jgi:hypothetical protein
MQEVSLLPKGPDRLFDPSKQPTTQLIPGTLSPQIKRTGGELDHSHISPRLQIREAIPLLPRTERPTTTLLYQAKIKPYRETFLFPKKYTVRIIHSPDDPYVENLC